MTEERKVVTWKQMVDIFDDSMGAWDTRKWKALPDAPKHTDEEYERVINVLQVKHEALVVENIEQWALISRQETQIKELEAKLDASISTNSKIVEQRDSLASRVKSMEAKVPPEDWSGPMCYNDYELCHDIQSCWNDCPYKPKEAKQ